MLVTTTMSLQQTNHRTDPEMILSLLEWDLQQDRLEEALRLVRSTFASNRHYQAGKLLPLHKTIHALLRRCEEAGRRAEARELVEFLAKNDESGADFWRQHLSIAR